MSMMLPLIKERKLIFQNNNGGSNGPCEIMRMYMGERKYYTISLK